MIYAFPILKNSSCYLRFRNDGEEPVTLTGVQMAFEGFTESPSPQILSQPIDLNTDAGVDLDITQVLAAHFVSDDPEECTSYVRFHLRYTPRGDQPQGRCRVKSKGRTIVEFDSE